MAVSFYSGTKNTVDKTITTFASLEALKAEELRQWQSLPAHERLRATSELTLALYRMKEPDRDVPRMQRTLVHLQREKR